MHAAFQFHHLPPSQPPFHGHPFHLLGLVALRRLALNRLRTLHSIWLRLSTARRVRASSSSGLRDHDAISITRSRNERCNTTILAAATNAFDAVRELDRQLLRTIVRRILGLAVSTRIRRTIDSMYSITVDDHLCRDKVASRSGWIDFHSRNRSWAIATTEGPPKSAGPFIGKKWAWRMYSRIEVCDGRLKLSA